MGVRALLFHFQVPPPHPPASVKFTAAAAHESDNNAIYCCAELSSQAFVFFDLCDRWETSFFFCRGSFWTGLPLGGDPCVHHGVTHTEDKHELELFLTPFFLCLPAQSSVIFSPSFPSCPCRRTNLMKARSQTPPRTWASASGGCDIWMETDQSLADVWNLKLNEQSSGIHLIVQVCVSVWTHQWPGEGWRSGADCPNAILASAFVKPGVVDGHHAPGLWKSARVRPLWTG